MCSSSADFKEGLQAFIESENLSIETHERQAIHPLESKQK